MDSQAAGVQVLIIMEKLSWDVSSDCWFAKQFLSVEMDWTLVTKSEDKIYWKNSWLFECMTSDYEKQLALWQTLDQGKWLFVSKPSFVKSMANFWNVSLFVFFCLPAFSHWVWPKPVLRRYAHGRIMRNHGMTSDQWIAVANRPAETLFEFLPAGERWSMVPVFSSSCFDTNLLMWK